MQFHLLLIFTSYNKHLLHNFVTEFYLIWTNNWAVKVVIQVALFVLTMLRKTYEQKQLVHKLIVD